MKKTALLLALFALMSANAQSENNDRPERSGFVLRVPRNAKQTYVQMVEPGPYFAAAQTLQLYPHEKVLVEAQIQADTIFALKTVAKNEHPERTFEIEFCQSLEKNTARPTQLWIKNPFDRKLTYNVLAYSIEDSQWQTSAHAAKPKTSTDALWKKQVVSSLVIKDWKLE